MHPNAQLITDFYAAFAKRDAEAMAACYAEDVHFSDPVFPDLKGKDAGDMWRMLCEAATDLEIVASDISADDTSGQGKWVATYAFSQTGRKVVNVISARFEFRDGKIVRHVDTFDLAKWTRMALGVPGYLLGWSSFLQNKVRGMAASGLRKWQRGQG